jgi:hypothetical protein
VVECGWSPADWEVWVYDSLCRGLLESA